MHTPSLSPAWAAARPGRTWPLVSARSGTRRSERSATRTDAVRPRAGGSRDARPKRSAPARQCASARPAAVHATHLGRLGRRGRQVGRHVDGLLGRLALPALRASRERRSERSQRPGGLKIRMCTHLAERRTSVPGVAGALVFAGVALAAAGALAFAAAAGDATFTGFALRPPFLVGRPKPSAIATSVSSSANALPASTGGVMYGAAASTSDASCGGTIGSELQEWPNGQMHRKCAFRDPGGGCTLSGASRMHMTRVIRAM